MTKTELLYKNLYRIRKAEDVIGDLYFDNEMKTPMHMSKGGEAPSVSVVEALGSRGQYCGTYRSHALYLTATGDLDGFFLELYGKKEGCSGGRGGSMHLFSAAAGLICTTAVVATNISVGVGAAFANKIKDNGKWVAVFFGDGAVDEGAFWESLNAACLMQLPVLFIYEDNGYAVHSPSDTRHGYSSIIDVVNQFSCNVYDDESNDVEAMTGIVQSAVAQGKPAFIRFAYYRYLEHVGTCEDFGVYRQRDEMEKWLPKDPVTLQRNRLSNLAAREIEQSIDREVGESVNRAKLSTSPKGCLHNGVFCE